MALYIAKPICYSAALNPELLHTVLRELAPLLSECDLHIAQLTLHLLTSVARKEKKALLAGGVGGDILAQVFTLLRSPLLQGVALLSLLEFLQALVEFNASGKSFIMIHHRKIEITCKKVNFFNFQTFGFFFFSFSDRFRAGIPRFACLFDGTGSEAGFAQDGAPFSGPSRRFIGRHAASQ